MPSPAGRKVAVVTGGTGGVGRAAVREFARKGYDVAVLEEVEAAAEHVERELGEIDVWVNCAFVGALAYFWDTTPEEYRRMTDVTYFGYVHGTRAALARMRPRDRGVVVQVGSAMAYRGIPLQSAYCGAKHAIKGFTESVVTELLHEGSEVKVCQVMLPGLNTTQFDWNLDKMGEHPMPVPPIFAPELPAKAIVFLAEHPRRNMWVGVATAYTILGERVAPKLMDWYLGRTGVTSQLTDEPLPRHGANTFEPRDEHEDRGAHGPFDAKTHTRDPVLWLSMHRWSVLGGAAAGAAAIGGALARRTR